jgi:hypothetical protein
MKARKNLYLSVEAVARGERLARGSHTSLSDVVEKRQPHYAASNRLKDFKLSHVPALTSGDCLERFHLA